MFRTAFFQPPWFVATIRRPGTNRMGIEVDVQREIERLLAFAQSLEPDRYIRKFATRSEERRVG